MSRALPVALTALLVAGCAGHEQLRAVDTREESIDHRLLAPHSGGEGAGSVQPYQLQPGEAFRMPRLQHAPNPELGAAESRRELAPTTVCLQLVVDAEGAVERSLPLADRPECMGGSAAGNGTLLQAAQQAVLQWRFAPAALCHFAAGQAPSDDGDCAGASRIEPVPVSLLYAFTFEIVHGRHYVRSQGR
ncbi:hypothetical protein OK348_07580 [Flavobacterium sp. MXW15]|uniref:Lipoprotein n=1 Tax=Xanthomonas chitinilytica TaxID=2989819 RepID=A0ABT3JTY7_9XANT|nr:hypothetical protein [Xanthomonas sp. H13-6]MCW4454656.1 hypothetical protein [Flavobacterium sp. MXW15]MCW4471895.1 hypothetical protein [Xanthomonas sp. H13-6]